MDRNHAQTVRSRARCGVFHHGRIPRSPVSSATGVVWTFDPVVSEIIMRPHRTHLDVLTSFRFFAAWMIVIQHTKWFFIFLEPIGKNIQLDLGVSFFFVLSGFVLFYNYDQLNDGPAQWRFLAMRVARIWPLHLFVLAVTLVCLESPWSYPVAPTLRDGAAVVFLAQAWLPFPSTIFAINGVSWSISVELFFYFMFPFLIHNISNNWAWKLIAISAMTILVLYAAHLTGLPMMTWGSDQATSEAFAFIFPPSRLLEFFLGISACAIFRKIGRISCVGVIGWSAIELAVLVTTYLSMQNAWRAGEFLHQIGFGNVGAKYGDESACGPVFCLLIITFSTSDGYFRKIIANKAFVFLGEISFSTYMIHASLFLYMKSRLFFGDASFTNAAAYASTLIVCSALSWSLVEKNGRMLFVTLYDYFADMHRQSWIRICNR